MKKWLVILMAVMMIAMGAQLAFSADMVESSGEVIAVDVAGSTVTVNCLVDAASNLYKQMDFTVGQDSVIEKAGAAAQLSDVVSGSSVSLVYSAGNEGKNTLVSMVVEN